MNRHLVLFLAILCFATNSLAQELHIGTAVTDITPSVPVALIEIAEKLLEMVLIEAHKQIPELDVNKIIVLPDTGSLIK